MTTTITRATEELKVVLTFNASDVYDVSTEPIKQVSPWIHSMQTGSNGSIALVVWDERINGQELKNVALTRSDVLLAFSRLVETGATHCSGYPIADIDNSDACTSDLVLQIAVYGSVVWS